MPIAPKIRFQISDNDGDKAATEVYVTPALTVAQYGTFANDYANALDDIVIGAVDTKAIMTVPVDLTGLNFNTVLPDSDVEQISAFQFVDTNGEPVSINVPGLIQSNVVTGTDSLDQAATAMATFITLMITGNGTVIPVSVAEADLVDTIYARKETRASGRKRR